MLRSNDSILRLVVYSKALHIERLAPALCTKAPAHIMQQLASGQTIRFLHEHPKDYLGFKPYPWDDAMLLATAIKGEQTRYAGIAVNLPAGIDFDP